MWGGGHRGGRRGGGREGGGPARQGLGGLRVRLLPLRSGDHPCSLQSPRRTRVWFSSLADKVRAGSFLRSLPSQTVRAFLVLLARPANTVLSSYSSRPCSRDWGCSVEQKPGPARLEPAAPCPRGSGQRVRKGACAATPSGGRPQYTGCRGWRRCPVALLEPSLAAQSPVPIRGIGLGFCSEGLCLPPGPPRRGPAPRVLPGPFALPRTRGATPLSPGLGLQPPAPSLHTRKGRRAPA